MTTAPALFVSHGSAMMAIEPGQAGAALQQLGRTLARPTAILASGSLTHNLSEFRGRTATRPEPYVREFQDWMQRAIAVRDIAAMLGYRQLAPHAVRAHPTDEHLLPLFGALGAAGTCATATRVTDEVQYGMLAMDAYVLQPSRLESSVEQAGRPARELDPRRSARQHELHGLGDDRQ